ncbi:PLDc N-terminal domain-containing protein [Aureivirga marina]|uniref:PLDc N-terminal domain-containing protein n=1 Tax=Aureivirga marina TaxID=1182451 RepID=UPI0018C9558B|nr:PLDc N-terminal domain-containing protein [Aureivirga marina]
MYYLAMPGPYQIILLLCIIFVITTFIDILKSKFNGNSKLVWFLVVFFLNFFGAILYFTIGRKQKLAKQ